MKSGVKRLLQLGAVLVACLAAHYAWAIAWPVVSCIIAVVMAIVWAVRLVVKLVGRVAIACQRACGGAPEAYGAEFYGPGTGKVPETAELRRFKKHDAEQWLVLKRGSKMVVFQSNGEPSSIKATGLFVAVDYDTVRGDAELTRELKGVDRVHLCRNVTCPEEGHHFQTYGITKEVDAEKIQLAHAGAAEACQGAFKWLWSTGSTAASKVKDYASESEPEGMPCLAHRIAWTDDQGDHVLSVGACKNVGTEQTQLLVEDQHGSEEACLCPSHASRYLLSRFCHKCSYRGCFKLGLSNDGGVQVCSAHKPQSRSRSSSKGRAREVRDDDPKPETVVEDVVEGDEAMKSDLKDVKRLLQEIQTAGKEIEGEDVENGAGEVTQRKKIRVASRSPGRTPKSSIHRNLAKVGMLDSPGEPRLSLIEEFFDRFAETRPLGVGEEEIRTQLAAKYDMSQEAVAQKLCDQAVVEQAKGQKGLTKFLDRWREAAAESGRESEGAGSSWSLVGKGSPPSISSSPAVPPTPPPGIPSSWNAKPLGTVRAPGVYGRDGDRRAGAGRPGDDDRSMAHIAEAIKNQTAELANLVRSQTETSTHPAGSMKGLGKQTEELVFLMRACGQYDVKLCPGEHGQTLAQGLISAQHGAATKLRNLGCRQKMTQRLAIALAGPYWGTHEKHAIGVADFISFTDAELDAYAWETSRPKATSETRPAPPTRLEEWEARVRKHIDMWCLVYGEEWRSVKTRAAHLLSTWHTGAPHQWPLTVMMDCWEELHWRFIEELKDVLRRLKQDAGRESMTLNEIKFHALMPDAGGMAWLQLPDTFDLENPESWFATEVKPRIERRQDRALWKLTWEGAGRRDKGLAHAGAREVEEPVKGGGSEKPTLKTLWGPKLTQEEVNRARDRAPTDRDGKLLCWGFLTHMGCASTNCQRAHEQLRGPFEALDAAVQMQLLRRGGLKRMKMETKEKVTERIKAIRTAHNADKASKIKDGVRKAGNGEDGKSPQEEADGRAGSRAQRVRFEVPTELTQVDYTKAEAEMQELVKGPDTSWVEEVTHQQKPHGGRAGDSALPRAKELVEKALELANGPVLSQLPDASDDLYSWTAARLAREPTSTLEELMGEMATYGLGDVAAEASEVLEKRSQYKAGERGRIEVGTVQWPADEQLPGQGELTVDGQAWTVLDYKEEIMTSEELASVLKIPEPQEEKRQCVTRVLAAGVLQRELGRIPLQKEVDVRAEAMRREQCQQALDALDQMGEPEEFVAAVEHELRTYIHDILSPHHEKDFRSLAIFPLEDMREAKLVVMRADYKGDLLVETVVGPQWRSGGWHLWALIYRGQMMLVQVPSGWDAVAWLQKEERYSTPSLGFSFFYHQRHDQSRTSPGRVPCRLCKGGRRAGEDAFTCLVRRHSCLASVAALAGSSEHGMDVQLVCCFESSLQGRQCSLRPGSTMVDNFFNQWRCLRSPTPVQATGESTTYCVPKFERSISYGPVKAPRT